MRRASPLLLELLESRDVPTVTGVPWPEADQLTLSFAPDGTRAGSQASRLFQALDAQLPRRVWELAMLRAFQTWAVQADLNVGLVPDSGAAFGVVGLKQGDPRF